MVKQSLSGIGLGASFAGVVVNAVQAGQGNYQTGQKMKKKTGGFQYITLLFVILNAIFIAGRAQLEKYNIAQDVLIWGNLLLFAITALSYFLAMRGLKNPNPHAFVRAVYGSILLKLFVCLIAAFIYIAMVRKELNKPAFFTIMGLYLVYTMLEVTQLTKQLRKKNG